ncbi:hypothetical protein [Ideonella sp. A 288]|uniref:hypothetical protein n=1 Tax=Ideonella sp. A 288 TaxID=1962181 RepID=UPI001185876E|nr:hypothetical protein [Ideonella sp. A 288]
MTKAHELPRTLSSIAVAAAFALAAPAAMAQGKGVPGGGGKPPAGETAVNNLSYPALDLDVTTSPVAWFFTIAPSPVPELGKTFSYGCDKKETIGTTEYPNTSCTAVSGSIVTYLTAAQCVAPAAPCNGLSVEKMFWQKIPANDWSSDSRKLLSGESLPAIASHVDWGDNLESRTWPSTSVLRVEVTPYADRTTLEPMYKGLQMWHVYGQGSTEIWGVRARDSDNAPFAYLSPYAILRTMNARLNLTKIVLGTAACPTAAQGNVRPDLVWNGTAWVDTGGGASTTWLLRDIGFTPELNVGGKWVYGYNWQLRRDGVPANVSKAGWWRLTFHSSPTAVGFSFNTVTAPPVMSGVPEPVLLSLAPLSASVPLKGPGGGGGETGGVYKPVVDPVNQITYLDICLN